MGRIYLIRHGQAGGDARDYDCLTGRGADQCRLTGQALAALPQPPGRAVSGAQRRHRQSAGAAGFAAPHADPGWNEFDYVGVIAAIAPGLTSHGAIVDRLAGQPDPGRAFADLYTRAVTRWMSGLHDGDYAESRPAFCARVIAGLDRLAAGLGGDEAVAVFTSGGPIAAVVQALWGLGGDMARNVQHLTANASFTTLTAGRGGVRLLTFNAHDHLDKAGVTTFR